MSSRQKCWGMQFQVRYKFKIYVLVLLFVSCKQEQNSSLTIAAAANMQFAMKELVADFTAHNGIPCELVIGSSGKLTAQIVEGAPYDILVAANMKYPVFIYNSGYAERPPEIYAYGKLVLWTADPSVKANLDQLTDATVEKIALANPQTAPYGEAAIQVLNHLGIRDAVDHKLVYGESIAQTNQFINSQAVSLGFTSLSVVLSKAIEQEGKWVIIPKDYYAPITQGVILINRDRSSEVQAQKFYDYLFSDQATEILEEFGYSRDE